MCLRVCSCDWVCFEGCMAGIQCGLMGTLLGSWHRRDDAPLLVHVLYVWLCSVLRERLGGARQASVRAIEHAASFLAQPGDELLLVHVLYDGGSLLRWCIPRRSLARATAFMQRRFAAALSRGAAAGVGHRMAVLRGEACRSRVSVAQALCLEARDVHARAVLLASDGRPSALGRIFGRRSLASQVARGASVPVIVAPPPREATKEGRNSAAASGHRKRVFLEAVSPRGGGSSIGAWRAGHTPPLQLQLSYNKLRDAGDDQGGAQGLWEHADAKVAQLPLRSHCEGDAEASVAANAPPRSLRNHGEGHGQANCAEWTRPRPLSPERAAGPAQGSLRYPTLGEAAVDAAARLRRAAEARRRAEAEAAPLGALPWGTESMIVDLEVSLNVWLYFGWCLGYHLVSVASDGTGCVSSLCRAEVAVQWASKKVTPHSCAP